MKKLVLISLAFLFIFTSSNFAQDMIPNHSFEEWDGDPVNWVNLLSNFGIENVVQSSDSHHGSSSAKFLVVWDDNTSSWLPATLTSLAIPVTENHATLHGYYKGTSIEGDGLVVNVLLYTSGGTLSGTGSFDTMESASEWTSFTVPITYLGADPDEAFIYLAVEGSAGDPHEGTEFYVDNLTWDAASNVDDLIELSDVSASPNPAKENINLEFSLEQPERFSIDLISPQGSVRSMTSDRVFQAGINNVRFDISTLPAGLYILKATGERYNFMKKIVVSR